MCSSATTTRHRSVRNRVSANAAYSCDDRSCLKMYVLQIVAFTATQIQGIDDKKYPPELSGPLYPEGIQIYPEAELQDLIKLHNVNK